MGRLGAVPASEIRVRFGLRLKSLRQGAGFKSARSFADALELDENRYTRYERGEVEPNLANICKICLVLGIQPNDLFSFEEAPSEPAAWAREAPLTNHNGRGRVGRSQAWRLASTIASLRNANGGYPSQTGGDPLKSMRATVDIYVRLLTHEPGQVVAEILSQAALDALEPDRKAELASLIHTFMR